MGPPGRIGIKIMKLHLLAAAAALLIGTSAHAADAPQAYGVHDWSGAYIGLQGGAGTGTSNHTNNFGITSGNFTISGGLGGWTTGYNWQRDNIVVGYEGDTSFGKIRGTSLAATCGAGCYTQINWISTYRARLGYAMGGVLPYVTGGLAVGTVKSGGTATAFRDTDTKVGWVAGAGIELAFNENYSAKAEYSYVDLGKADFPGAPGFVVKARADAHIFRVGINRKFDIFKILSR